MLKNIKKMVYGLHFDYILAAFLLLCLFAPISHAADPGKHYNPELPNVLIISDSIGNYTGTVMANLWGVANVFRIRDNAGNIEKGLLNIENWLVYTMDDGRVIDKWAVIHFNFGLWDLYRRTTVPIVQIERYRDNLEVLVKRMLQTGATLIFATTTIVPEGEPRRLNSDVLAYNDAALDVMDAYGVLVDDLYRLSAVFPPELFARPLDVHYSESGRKILGDKVADSIERALRLRWMK